MQLAGVCDTIKKIIQIYARKTGRRPRWSTPGFWGCVEGVSKVQKSAFFDL